MSEKLLLSRQRSARLLPRGNDVLELAARRRGTSVSAVVRRALLRELIAEFGSQVYFNEAAAEELVAQHGNAALKEIHDSVYKILQRQASESRGVL